jgi:hypothetical protein
MRTIAEIPHPDCKITIFSMNQKFIIKFEQGNLEQTYKIAEMSVTDGVNGIFQIVDDEFIQKITAQFEEMRNSFSEAYNRYEF